MPRRGSRANNELISASSQPWYNPRMSGPSDAAAAVRRSNQTYFEQVSQRATLSCGYAYFNTDFPRLPTCNFMGEVLLDEDTPDPLSAVRYFYSGLGLHCYRWIPADGQDPDAVGQLVEPLGLQRHESMTYSVPPQREYPIDERIRAVGARAMRRAYTRVIAERSAEHLDLADDLTAVQLQRLNDPQYDAFVGLIDDEPVGVISVYQVGAIGRLCDLCVCEPHRRKGIATALLSFAIQTARRWALRPICIEVSARNTAARALVEQAGFEQGSPIISFAEPGVAEVAR
jgi:GNAT superfamily N-acetyltransferase